MKIIVSHDIDHLSWSEHWLRDTYIPRYLLRHSLYCCRGTIDARLWGRRIAAPFAGKPISHLQELLNIDRKHNVPATYFIGMKRGSGMSYSHLAAGRVVTQLLEAGVEVGVHGVAHDDAGAMRMEFDSFRAMMPINAFIGVRNHYLRRNADTLSLQASAGYRFDSSEEAVRSPYVAHGIIEFPVCLMEVRLLHEDQSPGIEKAKAETERMVNAAEHAGISHFTILFHDIYYSPLFPLHREWYMWLIPWLRKRFELTDFKQASKSMGIDT